MPTVITDDFGKGGKPSEGAMAYEALPLATVVRLAASGDKDAVAWLNKNVQPRPRSS